jgi:hypothetical protein
MDRIRAEAELHGIALGAGSPPPQELLDVFSLTADQVQQAADPSQRKLLALQGNSQYARAMALLVGAERLDSVL